MVLDFSITAWFRDSESSFRQMLPEVCRQNNIASVKDQRRQLLVITLY